MTKIPGFEDVLLQLLECADESLAIPTETKRDFKKFSGIGFYFHNNLLKEALTKITEATGLDSMMKKALFTKREAPNILAESIPLDLTELASIAKVLPIRVHPHGASEKQIIWELASRVYVPLLAYNFAEYDVRAKFGTGNRLDKGMPASEFWYLPVVHENRLIMPVQKVMKWWLDLLGVGRGKLAGMISEKLRLAKKPEHEVNGVEETLKTWMNASSLPSLRKIREFCELELNYNGIFIPDPRLSPDEKYQAAVSFMCEKKLWSEESIKHQFLLPLSQVKKIVADDNVSDKDKEHFVRLVAERFAPPDADTLKRRLLIARMVQAGYLKLAKKMEVSRPRDATDDVKSNLALLLFDFYELLYNLFFEKLQLHARNDHAVFREDIQKTLLTRYEYVAPFFADNPKEALPEQLHHVLEHRQPDNGEPDAENLISLRNLADLGKRALQHLPDNCEPDAESVNDLCNQSDLKKYLLCLKKEYEQVQAEYVKFERTDIEIKKIRELLDRGNFISLEASIQEVSDYEILFNMFYIFNKATLEGYRFRHLIIKRLQSTAGDDARQRFTSLELELSWHTDPQNPCKRDNSDKKARELLSELKGFERYGEIYQAYLLLYEGRLLAQLHRFKEAQGCYVKALELMINGSIGPASEPVIYEGMAISAYLGRHFERFWKQSVHRGFIYNKELEKMIASIGWEQPSESIINAAFEGCRLDDKVRIEESFWSFFPYPYKNAEAIKRPAQNDELISEAVMLVMGGRLADFEKLIKRRFGKKPNKQTGNPRADSLLTQLIKLLASPQLEEGIRQILPNYPRMRNSGLIVPRKAIYEKHQEDCKKAIRILLEKTAMDVNFQDFKGQCVLHLASDAGETDLVIRLLEKGADIELADFIGRTPLMGAVLSRRKEMAKLLIYRGADIHKKTVAGNTPLHLAVEMGDLEMVRLLLKHGANVTVKNHEQMTPYMFAGFIMENPKMIGTHRKAGRSPAQLHNYRKIKEILRPA